MKNASIARQQGSVRTLVSTNNKTRARFIRVHPCESLESRTLFAATFPTPAEQYLVEVINRARANPNAEVQRNSADPSWSGTPDLNEGMPPGTITSNPIQPLAIDPNLTDAAQKHSTWGLTQPVFSHNEDDPSLATPTARAVTAGFTTANSWTPFYVGENISVGTIGTDLQSTVLNAHNGLFIDAGQDAIGNGTVARGHRLQMMNTAANLIGVGVATAQNIVASGGAIGTPAPQTITITTQNIKLDFNPTAVVTQPTDAAPVILQQPASVSVGSSNVVTYKAKGPATFTAAASGTPAPTYQWQVATPGGAYTPIAGATSGVYSFTPTGTENGNTYQCVISNSLGTVTTNAATLTLNGVGVFITTAPQSQTVNVGDNVTLTSVASGFSSTISWASLRTGPGSNYTTIAGATSPNYSFTVTPDMAGGTFFYQVSYANNQIVGQGDQRVAIITVNNAPAAPVVTAQPQATNATAGVVAPSSVLTGEVTAKPAALPFATDTGTTAVAGQATLSTLYTAYPAATVQWQVFNKTSKTYTDVAGLTGSIVTLDVNKSMNGSIYRAVITNIAGSTTTNPIKLAVNNRSVVSNELTNLSRASAAALAAIAPCGKAVATQAKQLTADLRRLKASKTQLALIKQYVATDAANRALLKKHESKTLATLKKDIVRVQADSAKLKKHPTDSALAALIQTELTQLESEVAANTVPADASQCNLGQVGDLSSIAATAPQDGALQSHIADAQSFAANIGQALQAPMTLALQIVARIKSAL